MNYKSLFSLNIGILVSFLPLNQANALTVSFSREYLEGYLQGILTANDNNNDNIISANEVISFQATMSNNTSLLGKITAEEEKSIEAFKYIVDEEKMLAFRVKTTGRELPDSTFPNDINLELDVDFQRKGSPDDGCNDDSELDFFRDGDAILAMCAPNDTRIAEKGQGGEPISVPESTSIIALLILGGFGAMSRLR